MRVRKLPILCAIAGIIIIGLYAQYWYDTRITQPALIQREVLGQQIASRSQLQTYEGSGAYGQGLWRWTYQVPVGKTWPALCEPKSEAGETCKFSRSRKVPGQEIQDTIEYSSGKLTITEIWY